MDTVTIGIPFLNAEETLAFAIESVLMQTHEKFRLILMNDGSTDGSMDVARRYTIDPRVKVIDDGEQLGLSARLNEIARQADSSLIARMDADDVMCPARISKQVKFLASNPEVDVVGTDIYLVDSAYRVIDRRTTGTSRFGKRFSYLRLFHPTIMGRTEWFRKHPYSSEFPRCEDVELWMRAGGGTNIRFLDEPLLFYNRFATPNTGKIVASLRDYQGVLKKYRSKIGLSQFLLAMANAIAKTTFYRVLGVAPSLWKAIPKASISNLEIASAQRLVDSISDRIKSRSTSTSAGASPRPLPAGSGTLVHRAGDTY